MRLYGSIAQAHLALRGGPGSGDLPGHPYHGGAPPRGPRTGSGKTSGGKKGGAGHAKPDSSTVAAAGEGLAQSDSAPDHVAVGIPDSSVEVSGDLTADDIAAFADDNSDLWDDPDTHMAVIQVNGKVVLSAIKLYAAKKVKP